MAAAVDPFVRFEDVHKAFGAREVLKGVSLEIRRREITVILGPSGTGKSVLLRHVLGLHQPDSGRVLFEERDLAEMSRDELYAMRKRLGMLFQDGALFDSLSVFENVAFPLRQHRTLSEADVERIVMEKLRLVGLADAAAKLPGELSGGMKKRAGLARALALDPELLLFDEPSSGLDPVTAAAIDELILATRERQQIACLIISHDVASTFRIADRIGMLHEGHLVAWGTPEEIRAAADAAPAGGAPARDRGAPGAPRQAEAYRDAVLAQFFARRAEGPIRAV